MYYYINNYDIRDALDNNQTDIAFKNITSFIENDGPISYETIHDAIEDNSPMSYEYKNNEYVGYIFNAQRHNFLKVIWECKCHFSEM